MNFLYKFILIHIFNSFNKPVLLNKIISLALKRRAIIIHKKQRSINNLFHSTKT